MKYKMTTRVGHVVERKFITKENVLGGTPATSWSFVLPSEIAPAPVGVESWCGLSLGPTHADRVGRVVTAKEWLVRGSYELPDATDSAQAADVIRIIALIDHQCNGQHPSVTDVFGALPSVHTFADPSNAKRFEILKDSVFTLNMSSHVAGPPQTGAKRRAAFEFQMSLEPYTITFSADPGPDVTALRSKNLVLMACSTLGRMRINDLTSRFVFTDE